MKNSFSPVKYEYREIIAEEIAKHTQGKIFYFNDDQLLDSCEGQIVELKEIEGQGLFIVVNPECQIRIDRIITVFGMPGAAFDEYDDFANQCLSCTGGYSL